MVGDQNKVPVAHEASPAVLLTLQCALLYLFFSFFFFPHLKQSRGKKSAEIAIPTSFRKLSCIISFQLYFLQEWLQLLSDGLEYVLLICYKPLLFGFSFSAYFSGAAHTVVRNHV